MKKEPISCKHSKKECRKCKYERYKKSDLVKVTYQNLKYNSKRRGKDFTLTLDEFRNFCIETKYISRKGIQQTSYHIDRIDEDKGYSIDNIQLLTNIENVRKYRKFIERTEDNKPIFKTITSTQYKLEFDPTELNEDDDDYVPF